MIGVCHDNFYELVWSRIQSDFCRYGNKRLYYFGIFTSCVSVNFPRKLRQNDVGRQSHALPSHDPGA